MCVCVCVYCVYCVCTCTFVFVVRRKLHLWETIYCIPPTPPHTHPYTHTHTHALSLKVLHLFLLLLLLLLLLSRWGDWCAGVLLTTHPAAGSLIFRRGSLSTRRLAVAALCQKISVISSEHGDSSARGMGEGNHNHFYHCF